MFHSLAFSVSLYGEFQLKEKNYNIDPEKGNLYIGFPNVLEWVKKHYSCDEVKEGMPLENDGPIQTLGSHWEKAAL